MNIHTVENSNTLDKSDTGEALNQSENVLSTVGSGRRIMSIKYVGTL